MDLLSGRPLPEVKNQGSLLYRHFDSVWNYPLRTGHMVSYYEKWWRVVYILLPKPLVCFVACLIHVWLACQKIFLTWLQKLACMLSWAHDFMDWSMDCFIHCWPDRYIIWLFCLGTLAVGLAQRRFRAIWLCQTPLAFSHPGLLIDPENDTALPGRIKILQTVDIFIWPQHWECLGIILILASHLLFFSFDIFFRLDRSVYLSLLQHAFCSIWVKARKSFQLSV